MNLLSLKTLALGLCALTLYGCATVEEKYKNYDRSRQYLHEEKYQDDPIVVPQKFSHNKIEDHYPVPPASTTVTTNEPNLEPPSNTIKNEKIT